MDSIVNRLTEIEDAAAAIVQHAEDQKEELNREYEEKRRGEDGGARPRDPGAAGEEYFQSA